VQNIAMQAAESSDINSLMTQQYINNQDITAEEFVKETMNCENIQVRRSARFMLDEGVAGLVGIHPHGR